MAVVAGVEDHATVVGEARHVVAIAERRPDRGWIRIGKLEGRIEVPIVICEEREIADIRFDIVAGIYFVPVLDPGGIAPAIVVETAVDPDLARDPIDAKGFARQGGLSGCRFGRDDGQSGQHPRRHSAAHSSH